MQRSTPTAQAMRLTALLLLLSMTSIVSAQMTQPPSTNPAPLPPIKALFDVKMRDTSICLGGDGMYYLTGTTGENIWVSNEGIELWRSPDLKTWERIGFVFTIEGNGTWQKQWTKKKGADGKEFDRRSVWAPEIHYFKNNYFIAYCITGLGTGILKSTTGKAEGPYVSLQPEAPLTKGIDASLFCDDDGTVWFAWGSGWYAKLKDDMTALASTPVEVSCNPPDLEPGRHHGSHCQTLTHVGFEGAFLFEANGKYHMACAERTDEDGRYSCFVADADSLSGPWGPRYLAVPCGGHNVFFQDKSGQWFSTIFGNDKDAPFRERPGFLPVEFNADGKIVVPLK